MTIGRINTATVDLDEPSEQDLIWVKEKIAKFIELTGSELGKFIIDNWQTVHGKLVKVFPRDYKRVLEEAEAEKKRLEEEQRTADALQNLNVDDGPQRTRTLSMDMQIAPTIIQKYKKKELTKRKLSVSLYFYFYRLVNYCRIIQFNS